MPKLHRFLSDWAMPGVIGLLAGTPTVTIANWQLGRWAWVTFWTAVSALFTAGAAIAAIVYVILTYRLWQTAAAQVVTQRRIAESVLMQSLMIEYDGMREDIRRRRNYYIGFPVDAQALDAFRNALMATGGLTIEDVFLNDVDPLDQVRNQFKRARDSIADRAFYRELLRDLSQLQSEVLK